MERFQAVLRREESGGHLVEVPLDVPAVFGEARPRVRGTVDGHPFSTRILKYGGVYYLGFNREVRDAAGIREGDRLEIELERDETPREVDVPADLAQALASGRGPRHV